MTSQQQQYVCQIVLDYCAAVRGILNDNHGSPLWPAGWRMAHALLAVCRSLERNLAQPTTPIRATLCRLHGYIQRGLARYDEDCVRIGPALGYAFVLNVSSDNQKRSTSLCPPQSLPGAHIEVDVKNAAGGNINPLIASATIHPTGLADHEFSLQHSAGEMRIGVNFVQRQNTQHMALHLAARNAHSRERRADNRGQFDAINTNQHHIIGNCNPQFCLTTFMTVSCSIHTVEKAPERLKNNGAFRLRGFPLCGDLGVVGCSLSVTRNHVPKGGLL